MNPTIDITNIKIQTPRLTLRPWKHEDLDDFYEYARVDGVGQHAGWFPHENKEKSRQILEGFIEKKKVFAIEYNKKVIGSLGVEYYREDDFPELASLKGRELGYVLSKDYWGLGLMPEAVKAVIEYLFEIEGLDFIIISYFEWNRQSARVAEKCGLKPIKNTVHETRFGTKEPTVCTIIYNK